MPGACAPSLGGTTPGRGHRISGPALGAAASGPDPPRVHRDWRATLPLQHCGLDQANLPPKQDHGRVALRHGGFAATEPGIALGPPTHQTVGTAHRTASVRDGQTSGAPPTLPWQRLPSSSARRVCVMPVPGLRHPEPSRRERGACTCRRPTRLGAVDKPVPPRDGPAQHRPCKHCPRQNCPPRRPPMMIPAEMRHIAHVPGGPEGMSLATGPVPQPQPGEVLIRVHGRGRQPAGRAAAPGRLPAPARRQPAAGIGSRRRSRGRERHGGYRSRRPGLRADQRRRLCRVLHCACGPMPALARGLRRGARRRAARDLLHRVGQPVRPRPPAARRARTGPWRHAVASASPRSNWRTSSAAPSMQPPAAAEKCAACLRLGADAAINYRTADFPAVVKALTAGAGVDVVLDMVGAPYFARNLRLPGDGRPAGADRLPGGCQAGGAGPDHRSWSRRLTITGSTMRPRTAAQKAAIADALRAKVWPVLDPPGAAAR